MNRPLDTIIELQTALDELHLAEQQLGGIPDWMAELHAEHSTALGEIEGHRSSMELAESERRAAEAGVSDLQEKLQNFQAQISRVRNQREYGALLHEIDTAKEQIKQLEEQSLEAISRQDEARGEVEEMQEGFTELDDKYKVELEKWEAQKPAVAEQVERLKETIQTLRERLPKGLLLQFDRIFERYKGRALTEVQRIQRLGKGPQIWHCGTCNYRVRPQAVVEILNHGKVVPCDSCKRILYITEDPA